jgi:hypothetical protein
MTSASEAQQSSSREGDRAGRAAYAGGGRIAAVTALLLILAGGLQGAAAVIRWAPCLGPAVTVITPGGFEADTCALAVDHLRDYAWVSAPFEPIPGAVVLAGVASVLMAAMWVVWAVRMRGDRVVLVFSAITVATWVLAGGTQLIAALSGGALGVFDYGLAGLLVIIAASVAPVVAALRLAALAAGHIGAGSGLRRGSAAGWVLVAVAAVLSFPLVDYLLLSPFSGSHDSPVWSAGPAALALIAAGVTFAVAGIAAAWRRRLSLRAQVEGHS